MASLIEVRADTLRKRRYVVHLYLQSVAVTGSRAEKIKNTAAVNKRAVTLISARASCAAAERLFPLNPGSSQHSVLGIF